MHRDVFRHLSAIDMSITDCAFLKYFFFQFSKYSKITFNMDHIVLKDTLWLHL